MTELEQARNARDLVCKMVELFTELTDEYWYDSHNHHNVDQLNTELNQADINSYQDLKRVEQAYLNIQKQELSNDTD